MDSITFIGMVSIITAGLTIAIGSIGPALGEGRAVAQALSAIAQQPDERNTGRIDGDLLFRGHNDFAVRQPFLELRGNQGWRMSRAH